MALVNRNKVYRSAQIWCMKNLPIRIMVNNICDELERRIDRGERINMEQQLDHIEARFKEHFKCQ